MTATMSSVARETAGNLRSSEKGKADSTINTSIPDATTEIPYNGAKVVKTEKIPDTPEVKIHLHPILTSHFAGEVYIIVLLSIYTRSYWLLHGVTLLTLSYIADIIYSWFLHVKEAKEIRDFQSWLVWWTNIGLKFATNTIEGRVVNRVLVANTLNFWNLVGKNYTINWFDNIASKGRKDVLDRTKNQLEQSKQNYKEFSSGFRGGLAKLHSLAGESSS